jgi:L-asparaginase / beta-aspartyl-peptidase
MWVIGIHGGAGALRWPKSDEQVPVFDAALDWATAELARGISALDVVEGVIRRLEDAGCFVAGRGSWPNASGMWELDASIMHGPTRKAGAVAALAGVYPPIAIARAVMEKSPHVMLAGQGAHDFAMAQGFGAIADPASFFTVKESRGDPSHGTVGAVALDMSGAIAAGTSTGGIRGKRPGRVGDSPIIGAGTWADALVGVSCTGHGEYFIRSAAAHSVAVRHAVSGTTLDQAVAATLEDMAALGGEGGIIAVDARGALAWRFNAESMRLALANSEGRREIRVATRSRG